MKNKVDLFERYLQAVKRHLPWKRQDDILAELRANLEAQLEEREEEQGRPLTSDEMAEWLKHLGSPMHVAARYQPQQYLIGPAIFPMYWFVLRMAFLWATVIYSIVTAITIAVGPVTTTAVVEGLLRLPVVLMTTAAWITLVFAAIEFTASRYPSVCPPIAGLSGEWSPASLPPLEKATPGGKRARSYAHAVAELIFGYMFLIWLILIPRHPFLLLGPGVFYVQNSPFQLAQVWIGFYWTVLALNVVQVAWNGYRLWRGSWQDPSAVYNLVAKTLGLIPTVMLLSARGHIYLLLKRPDLDGPRYAGTLNTINLAIWHGLQVVCLILVLQLIAEIVKAVIASYRRSVAAQ